MKKSKIGEWRQSWKIEYVVPIAKIALPSTEDNLRPISLTPTTKEKNYLAVQLHQIKHSLVEQIR